MLKNYKQKQNSGTPSECSSMVVNDTFLLKVLQK